MAGTAEGQENLFTGMAASDSSAAGEEEAVLADPIGGASERRTEATVLDGEVIF